MNRDEIINALEKLFETAEKFKKSYFFSPPGNANGRRSHEKYHSIPEFTFEESGNTYTCEFVVECSCKNVYAKGKYTKNGKKTTLTAIRNAYNRLIVLRAKSELVNLK